MNGEGENVTTETVYECTEKQFRIDGQVDVETIEQDFDFWWENTTKAFAQTIGELRTSIITQMSAACNAIITNGVDVTLSSGETKHFSLALEDQLNLLSLQGLLAAGAESVPYHADGEECSYYSAADFTLIANAATKWKLYQESYFNALRSYVESIGTISELTSVTYGMTIPEAYQTDVLKALLAQA